MIDIINPYEPKILRMTEQAHIRYVDDREFYHFVVDVWHLMTGKEGSVCAGREVQWKCFILACSELEEDLALCTSSSEIVECFQRLRKVKYVTVSKKCQSILWTL